jgi:hypothetical protein
VILFKPVLQIVMLSAAADLRGGLCAAAVEPGETADSVFAQLQVRQRLRGCR